MFNNEMHSTFAWTFYWRLLMIWPHELMVFVAYISLREFYTDGHFVTDITTLALSEFTIPDDNYCHKPLDVQDYPTPESLLQTKSQKKLILTGAARFNTKPKTGVAFLEENNLIYHDLSPNVSRELSLAKFLKSCTRLDKRLLGDFISRPDNIEVLKAYIGLFDFHDVRFAIGSTFCRDIDIRSPETRRRCYARATRGVQATWRITADCSHHGDVRRSLLCC